MGIWNSDKSLMTKLRTDILWKLLGKCLQFTPAWFPSSLLAITLFFYNIVGLVLTCLFVEDSIANPGSACCICVCFQLPLFIKLIYKGVAKILCLLNCWICVHMITSNLSKFIYYDKLICWCSKDSKVVHSEALWHFMQGSM